MQFVRPFHRLGHRRRGLTAPAVAIALLVSMAGLALILDRLWLEAAQLELTTAAEATALAAARQLAADDRLIPNSDPAARLDAARTAAEAMAASNLVAGQPPSFSVSANDILFGNYSPQQDGSIVFDTEADDPQTVRITLHRSRSRNNPVALFIRQVTGVPFGNVVRQADGTVNNRIAGIRPVSNGTALILPLAILKVDPSGNRQDAWNVQIEQRRGTDNFRYDTASRKPVPGDDGIPEIAVRSLSRGGRPELCNLQVLDLGTGFDDSKLRRQFQAGVSAEDLQAYDGWLNLADGTAFASSADLLSNERDDLESLLGEPRICLLFTAVVPTGQSSQTETTCTDFVAVRVMAVNDEADGSCTVVLQPTVVATRCAVVTDAIVQPSTNPPNPYIFNLQLTN